MEGSVPPTSGFGDRRSPLSYTRIYSRGNRLSCGLVQAVRWPVWNVAVLPCFSTSRDSPVACCDLPISGRLRSACPRLSVVSAVVLPARTWLDSNQRHFNRPSFRAALPTELQVHMVSRRRGGCTAGRLEGKEREEGAGACTILPRLYCKTSIWLFKFNLHPLARNFSPPF